MDDSRRKQQHSAASARYRKNHAERIGQASKARVAANRSLVNSLKSNPCLDCGRTFPPVCMDFDHREGEEKIYGSSGGVARLIQNGSQEKILNEVAKCDLVCSNCHRIRTATKAGWHQSLTRESETVS